MDREYAEYLLSKTKEDYNLIAEDFSRTRKYVEEDRKSLLLQNISPKDRVLDLGCGNGRFFEVFKDLKIDYFGIDNSEKIIEIAKKKYPQGNFQVADALDLPFQTNYFDKILSLAVFHHIPSEEIRLSFLEEAKRVLKPNGLLILTVWNLNPTKMIFIGKWNRALNLLKLTILKILGISKLDFGDFFINWREVTPRYIHYFTRHGLKKITKKAGFLVKEVGILGKPESRDNNIYIIAEK